MSKSYEQGVQDGVALYGKVCSSQSSCADCMIGQLRGESLTCQEFMKQFPGKMISLLTEMDSKDYTFYNEYITRFPNCGLTVDELSDIVCRKAIFEGVVNCEGGDCKSCWLQTYTDDVTESELDADENHEE